MDEELLTLEIKQENNPGFTDFGSGNIIALTSQCLRCAKKPTPCTICSEFCPRDSIETVLDGRPRLTNANCMKCAACVGICPTNALGSTTRTSQQFTRHALQATLRVDHLAIGCERTCGLLRLQSHTDKPDAALAALRLIEEAKANDHLLLVPCLAMLVREVWFAVLNEIGTFKFAKLSVFLPPGQCAQCPVNDSDNVEDLFGKAIVTAEQWSGHSVDIITCAEDLPQTHKANVRAYLTSGKTMDRRGVFTGFLDELKQSWEDNAVVGNKALDEVQYQRERRKTFDRTRLSVELKKPRQANRNPIAVTSRYALIEALGRNDLCAEDVKLLISATDHEKCDLCGVCVDVCPVKARSLVETDNTAIEEPAASPSAHSSPAFSAALQKYSAQSFDAPLEQKPEKAQKVVVGDLFCLACSACLQACPNGACYFTEIDASQYLLDEPEPTPTVEPKPDSKTEAEEKPEETALNT